MPDSGLLISRLDFKMSSIFCCFFSNSFEQQLTGLLTSLLTLADSRLQIYGICFIILLYICGELINTSSHGTQEVDDRTAPCGCRAIQEDG